MIPQLDGRRENAWEALSMRDILIDIGIPEDYFRFQEDVKKGVVSW